MVLQLIAGALGGMAATKAVDAGVNLAGDAFKAVLGQNGPKPTNTASADKFLQRVTDEQSKLAFAGNGSSGEGQALNKMGDAVKEYAKAKTGDGVDFSKGTNALELVKEIKREGEKLVAEGKRESPEAKALVTLVNSVSQYQQEEIKTQISGLQQQNQMKTIMQMGLTL
jgi:putative N-acetylmannosamine-6-phosphate epimerase